MDIDARHAPPLRGLQTRHFDWSADGDGRVATLTLNRPDKKNPLTFESYAELRDLFRDIVYASDVRAIVLTGAGGNFCSGGDVFEIIEPLTRMSMPDLLAFTRMTGDVIKAMRKTPQPIICAIDGICAGAGAMLALASDLRYATPQARTAFLFTRVGLAGRGHGRLRAAAACDRPGPRRRAAVHRPCDDRRGGPGLGLLQRPACVRRAAGEGAGHGSLARRRPLVRTRRHQDHDEPGMGHGHRGDGRVRGAGAGDLHGRPRTSAAPSTRSPRSRSRSSRGTDVQKPSAARPSLAHLDWPFFGPEHRVFARAAGSLDRGRRARRRRSFRHGRRLQDPGHDARRGRASSTPAFPRPSAGRGTNSIPACSASPASGSPMPTASPISPSPCRDSAPAPSRFPARRQCSSVCCRRWPRER